MKIIGTGSYLPEFLLTNAMLEDVVDTSDEWIRERTGIKERRISTGEGASMLAIKAAKRALEDSQIAAGQIDLIIVATATPDYYTPSIACLVQKEVGADNAICFDMNAACSGFLYAMNTAYAYMLTGVVKNALIIGAETVSRLINYEDRTTCILFGDGAGAAVVQKEEDALFVSQIGADGFKSDALVCRQRIIQNIAVQGESTAEYLHMNGQEVYKFVVRVIPKLIKEVVAKANLELSDIKYFLLHQANSRMNQVVASKLGLEEEKFPSNLEKTGNTSAASIPILLDEVNKKGKLEKGDKLVICAFGSGLTWSAVVLEW